MLGLLSGQMYGVLVKRCRGNPNTNDELTPKEAFWGRGAQFAELPQFHLASGSDALKNAEGPGKVMPSGQTFRGSANSSQI